MSDKRIIELPTLQTALGNDAWLVVDVESGATYKIKKSALLGLQSLETQSQEVYGAINEVRSLAEDLVSDEYDATSAYAKGDYCIYNNTLYKCTTAIGSGGEAWNASHWSATKCDDELSELKQSLTFNTLAKVNYASTSSDYEYVGIQIVVPTGKTALIVISTIYISRSPQGLGLSLSSTLWDAANKQYWCELNPIKYTPAILLDSGTYYVWAKREGASGNNPYTVKGIIF